MNAKHMLPCLLGIMLPAVVNAQAAYWQQQVDHQISVTLDDKANMLRGHSTITYQNNSPDSLKFIYFHLYPNAFRTDRTAYEKQAVENGHTDHYFSDADDRGYMDSLKFTASYDNGDPRSMGVVVTTDPDVIKLVLPDILPPGGRLLIETPFRVKIPKTFSRLGHGRESFQVSQWFPKPAVYDAKGWHPLPYLDQGEFYSEFGNYEVAVTLPANYIIMGSGNIQEESERAWLEKLAAQPLPADTLYKKSRPLSAEQMKTVTFEEQNIHDFAWFADKTWIVRKDTVSVPGGGVVEAFTCFTPEHQKAWSKSLVAVKTAINGYSSRVGAYPYRTVKAVEGPMPAGGGMEYPTITIIAATPDADMVRTAIVHEVGHNWFYGMLGSNERNNPWMDEGINSFYEQKLAPDESAFTKLTGGKDGNFLGYATLSATHNLLPANSDATLFPEMSYGVDIYGKTAYLVAWLEDYMGPDSFETAMKDYFRTWQYKHPQPEDFEAVMRRHSNKNLDWFFSEAMTTNKPVDFALQSVSKKDGLTVKIKNKTGFKAPVKIALYPGNQADSAFAWTEPFTGTATVNFPGIDRYKELKIAGVIPDYNIRNNDTRRRWKLKPFLGFNMDRTSKTFISPALGFNYYDGFMAGILLHNLTLPQHKFQYMLAPLYGFGSKTAAGTGVVGYTAYFDQGFLHDIQFNVEGKTFSYTKNKLNVDEAVHARFVKVAPEVIFNLRKPYPRSPVTRTLSLKGYWIREDQLDFNMSPVDSLYRPSKGGYEDNFYARIRYRHDNDRTFNPFNYTLEGQAGKQFAKLSVEANLRIDYFKKNKALYLRAYAGKFFNFASNDFDAYRYRIANTYSGANDYLYDETYLGRNEQRGFYAQQISMKEGGFKVNTLQYSQQLGLTDDWLFALNIKTDLPFWNLPVRIFADVATFADAKRINPSGAGVLYEAGLEVSVTDYITIYLPLVLSKDLSEYTKSVYPENRFLKTIAFSINLDRINWLKLPSKILKM
ncbi:M1 family metallopeptidase [Taibaiella chishuiensis]|nr:M1 family metallopeptidase [Taibaiella chishuiensis]